MTPAAQSPMPPEAQQLLQEMHGIIVPAAVGWWPPAPGWWMLATLLLAAVIALAVALHKWRQRNAYKHAALTILDELRGYADEDLANETNRLLKRVALVAFPAERALINQLFGDAWVAWLNQSSGKSLFTGNCAEALAHGTYRSALPCSRGELLACTRRWLVDHKSRLALKGGSTRV